MTLQNFIKQAQNDLPVYITDVRVAFQKEGTRPLYLRFRQYDGSVLPMDLMLPEAQTEEEKQFISRYVYALLYNTLSAAGAGGLDLYYDAADCGLQELAESLDEVFCTKLTKAERFGYGKSLNVNERILHMLFPEGSAFAFALHPLKNVAEELPEEPAAAASEADPMGEDADKNESQSTQISENQHGIQDANQDENQIKDRQQIQNGTESRLRNEISNENQINITSDIQSDIRHKIQSGNPDEKQDKKTAAAYHHEAVSEKNIPLEKLSLERLPEAAEDQVLLGMDIGGTDIKFIVSVFGKLAVCKEFDWNPASSSLASQILTPVRDLVRLLRAAASLYAAGMEDQIDEAALSPRASEQEIREGILRMETAVGEKLRQFDGIGVSFPDVVIRNSVIGGETPKTAGLRANTELDYEEQFSEITRLREHLAEFVTENGSIAITNDGNMAAFTSAVEQAAEDPAGITEGFFAHSLGTDLGSGWVLPDGSIPDLPLEIYNFIIDLGSSLQARYPAEDLRSTRNLTTDLPGSLQRYTGQGGVFRLAAKYLPQQDPELWQEALNQGFFTEDADNDRLLAVTAPRDMRKPALEFFMQKAADGHPVCGEIFRQIGEYLAVTWAETECILHPEAKARNLFGRFVRKEACFRQMCEGAGRRVSGLTFYAADSTHSATSLMKQLDAMPDYTVAQFGQAVGSAYYAARDCRI